MGLTARQERFVDEYVADLNAAEAAKRAGYSPRTARSQGQRLLTNVDIAKEIERRQQDRADRTRVTADVVIERLNDVYQTAMEAPEGERPNLSAANKALELLGRHTGAYERRVALPKLPEVQTAPDAVQAMGAVLSAVAVGNLTPSEGQAMSSLIETCRRTIETEDLARRLENLERQTKGNA